MTEQPTDTSPHNPPCTEGDHCGELHCPPADRRRRLTEAEHDRAWHAIEGIDWEAGPDPDTVLNAVLAALHVDPPTAETQTPEKAQPAIGAQVLARMLNAADVEINHGDYPAWGDLAESGVAQYQQMARYLLDRTHITARSADQEVGA